MNKGNLLGILSLTDFHRWTEAFLRTGGVRREIVAPPPSPTGPSPFPSPEGKGRNHRDTPIRRTKASCCPLLVSTIAETLCVLCMPKAFCGLKTCAKMLCKLCGLCERKNSPASLKRPFSHWGCILFLTDLHRWTEHTKFHRDIKSTDNTEPYSHLWQ